MLALAFLAVLLTAWFAVHALIAARARAESEAHELNLRATAQAESERFSCNATSRWQWANSADA